MAVCASCGFVSESAFKFCPECGAEHTPTEASREQRKTVTVLFCDLTGSTSLGEAVDPEALRALLARYFERMKRIVEDHGGSVEKFIGDAVMAVFGVPVLHEDDALRAARAAAEMRGALPDLGLQARIGVNSGEVVTGTEERLATGDAVNVAARLEQAAQPGEVLLGQATLALLRDAVDVEPVAPLQLKGKAEPIPAYRLLRVRRAPERRHETTFVGREREVALVRETWERVQNEQRCQLVTVVGDAGVGKSRLAGELVASLAATVVRGRCLPYGEGTTYWPVVEVLKQLDVRPADKAAADAIESLLGNKEVATSAEEIAWAFRKTLEQAASRHPLVVLFDDIHWGEQTFLDLVEHVALLSSGASILLLCLARSELRERRPDWPVTLRLEPLPDADVAQLIPKRIRVELRAKIARAAGGNPLFIAEMLAMADEATGEVVVPPTLRALLAARLDQLETAERSVLERGAVEGEVFHRSAVQALARDDTQVTPRLAALVRKQLIRPDRPLFRGEDGFRFRHLLIRDAAYDALPKAVRAELHERFGTWLDERGAELVERDELLGYHLQQAASYRRELDPTDPEAELLAGRAAERLASAGARASHRGDDAGAADLIGRAVDLFPADHPQRLDTAIELAMTLWSVGEPVRARGVAQDALEAARAATDARRAIHAEIALACIAGSTDADFDVARLRPLADRARPLFEEHGDDIGLSKLFGLVVWRMETAAGRYAAAGAAAERAIHHARAAWHRRAEQAIVGRFVDSLVLGPRPVEEGLRRCDELLAEGEASAARDAEVLSARAALRALAGRLDSARADVARVQEIYQERGNRLLSAQTLLHAGTIELDGGEPAAAEQMITNAIEILRGLGQRVTIGLAYLAHALCDQQRFRQAIDVVDEAARAQTPVGQNLILTARARALAGDGDVSAAVAIAEQAAAIVEPTDALNAQAWSRLVLGETLVAAGRTDEASSALREALERYHRKGNVQGASRARAVLARVDAV